MARITVGGQESCSLATHESVAPPAHVPSSGLTLEALLALPPTPTGWPRRTPEWFYRPYAPGSLYPYTTFPTSVGSHTYPFGLGGYYPPRGGSYYPEFLGWWVRSRHHARTQ
ncbi:hypothetical protein J0H58_16080 [bacterium]|nr:hypothetical protein [bacterium]